MSSAIDQQVALTNEITAILRERIGHHEQFAVLIAKEVVAGLVERRAGDLLYVPTGTRSRLAERNQSIRREFNGRNAKLLCATHQISRTRLYEIVGEKSATSAPK